jgi:hypothetical protein
MTLARAESTDGQGHNDSSSSTGSGRPGVTLFVCVHCTSTCQLSSCSLQVFLNRVPGRSQAPLPVRAASKLELPACHRDAGPGAAAGTRTSDSESGPAGPSDPEGVGGAAGPAPYVRLGHQPPGDAAEQCSDSCI